MTLTKVRNQMISGAAANVLDFGADPTGATDSTAAIRSALASITSGGTLVFPSGQYVCDTVNAISASGIIQHPYLFNISANNTAIIGEKGAQITVTASAGAHADLFVVTAETGIKISGIKSVGVPYVMTDSGDASTTGGIFYAVSLFTSGTEAYKDIEITDNYFQYCLKGGFIQTTSTLENATISGNTLKNIRGHGIAMYKAKYCNITDNYIEDQQTHRQNPYISGSTFQGLAIDVSDYCNYIVVSGNTINNCVFGIKSENDTTIASQDASDVIIESNIITNVNVNEVYGASSGYYGIKAASERVTVTNNNILTCYGTAIAVETGDNKQLIISHNHIDGCMDFGISLEALDNSGVNVVRDRALVQGNMIYGQLSAETPPVGIICSSSYVTIDANKIKDVLVGIQASNNGHSLTISNNMVKDATSHGIYATSINEATFDIHDLQILGNFVELSGSGGVGIYLVRADICTVSNNRVISTTSSSTQRGIYVSTDATNDDGKYLIIGNYVKNWFRNIVSNNAKDINVCGNNILGHGTSDRGINIVSTASGLITGNFVDGCNEGIITQADNANILIDSNNTAGSTTGISSSSATIGTNV